MSTSTPENTATSKRGFISLILSMLALWPISLPLAISAYSQAVKHKTSRAIGLAAITLAIMSAIVSGLVVMVVVVYVQQASGPRQVPTIEPSIIRDYQK